MVHRRDTARRPQGHRPGRSPLLAELWVVAGRSTQGRARTVELGRRRPELDEPREERPRPDWPVRFANRLLLGSVVVGRADRRVMLRAAYRRPAPQGPRRQEPETGWRQEEEAARPAGAGNAASARELGECGDRDPAPAGGTLDRDRAAPIGQAPVTVERRDRREVDERRRIGSLDA